MAKFSVTSILDKIKNNKKAQLPLPKKIWSDPIYFIGFGFGTGASPIAPGTVGTLAAIPIYLLMRPLPLTLYLALLTLFVIGSSWISDRISREIGVHDHPGVNLDEFVGFLVTMTGAPEGWWWILLGFVLFRLFDIGGGFEVHDG